MDNTPFVRVFLYALTTLALISVGTIFLLKVIAHEYILVDTIKNSVWFSLGLEAIITIVVMLVRAANKCKFFHETGNSEQEGRYMSKINMYLVFMFSILVVILLEFTVELNWLVIAVSFLLWIAALVYSVKVVFKQQKKKSREFNKT